MPTSLQAAHYGAGVGTAPYYGVPGTGVGEKYHGYGHDGYYGHGYGHGYYGGHYDGHYDGPYYGGHYYGGYPYGGHYGYRY